ncbi:MAG TPA: glycosyltransferase family 2 protein [Candidatus Scatovivens faecipullorum]|nr:glycosyltransferase family 2 protein [Candidatus Scatovivens faecipullorum]
MKKITIFTPTYNRAYILGQAYESLKRQTNKNFIWLIIDDGSTDATEKLVNNWKNEKIIEIDYIKKKNGGKHTAYNMALENVRTELILLCLDSDDYLVENAVERLLNEWEKNKNKRIKGIVALCDSKDLNKAYCKKYIDKELKYCSLNQALVNEYFDSEAIFLVDSQYAQKFKYPEFNDEKFFTEAYILYQMTENFFWLKESLCIREYRNDGLTKNIMKIFAENPKSWFLYNRLRLKVSKKVHLKYAIYYIAFGLLAKEKEILKKSPKRIITFFVYPLGIIGYFYIKKNKGN